MGQKFDLAAVQIAGLTPGFTGADLANLVNEAAIVASRESASAKAKPPDQGARGAKDRRQYRARLRGVSENVPRASRVCACRAAGRLSPRTTDPGEATDVALAVQDAMRTARREYGNIGTVHLFMAAPAGLAMLIGQLLNTFGSVQTYEHVTVDGSGQYRPAALLRPNT